MKIAIVMVSPVTAGVKGVLREKVGSLYIFNIPTT
jgi:hypothetical protein